jgi:hypothetical protein
VICPQCHSEFVPGVVECPDCRVPLAERPDAAEGSRGSHARDWKWLWLVVAALVGLVIVLWTASSDTLASDAALILYLFIYAVLLYGLGRMAIAFNRSVALWVALAVLFTPLIAAVFLFAAGDVPEPVQPRASLRDRTIDGHVTCPGCGAEIDWGQGEGVHSPVDQPWQLLRDRCETEIRPDLV